MFDLLVQFLAQIGGGPGPPENNLVRFGLPAIFWAVLFFVALSRQRREYLPRERLLLFGFALAFCRELFMFLHTAERIVVGPDFAAHFNFIEPLEHALAVSAVLLISAAFLRYILDDVVQPRRYLLFGFSAMGLGLLYGLLVWPAPHAADPTLRFDDTSGALVMHSIKVIFVSLAIFMLIRNKGWLRNVVIVALSFLLTSVILGLINSLLGRTYDYILCPISNNLHIWAVPLFGFVYFREQSIARKQAEEALDAYRGNLEELVEQRTAELSATNEQLQLEVAERARIEKVIMRRNAELSTQSLIAAAISRSLDLDEVLQAALEQALQLLDMDRGCILLLDCGGKLQPQLHCRAGAHCTRAPGTGSTCACQANAWRAIRASEPAVTFADECVDGNGQECSLAGSYLLLSAPLVAHGKALGALTLASDGKRRVSTKQIAILASIGQQVGVAADNARLYLETEQWARGMSRLHDMSLELNAILDPKRVGHLIAVQAATLLDCSAAGLFRLENEGQTAIGIASYRMVAGGVDGMRLPITGSKLLQSLIEHGEPAAVEDVRADARIPPLLWQHYPMRALLAVPVRGIGDLQGLLFLVEATATRYWKPAEIRLLLNFANRAGVAWENAYLHKQLESLAALEERQRIAAEMHDGLAQTISTLALRNDQATQLVEAGALRPALHELSEIQDIIDVAGSDLRRSIASLQETPRPPCSLQGALQNLTHLDLSGNEPEVQYVNEVPTELYLPPEELDQIVCIAKEALINAARHAAASTVTIRLAAGQELLAVSVEDNGCGFDAAHAALPSGNHFGLNIMRARAQRLGGELIISSAPGQGTCVVLQWKQPEEIQTTRAAAAGFVTAETIISSDRRVWEGS